MREALSPFVGSRIECHGTIVDDNVRQYGTRSVWKFCITNVTDPSGNELADHVWVPLRKPVKDFLHEHPGQTVRVRFRAKVVTYVKGYQGDDPRKIEWNPPTEDIGLSDLSRLTLVRTEYAS